MEEDRIITQYFDWLCQLVDAEGDVSYNYLLRHLFYTPFTYMLKMDSNRESDGKYLRYRFACRFGYRWEDIKWEFDGVFCSVLEMMVALANRCEEDIMQDPDKGDRLSLWFWTMIESLGLDGMDDVNYNEMQVDSIISRFLNRRYKPNGRGGLFTVRNSDIDMRAIEIWYQMMWFLDEYIDKNG